MTDHDSLPLSQLPSEAKAKRAGSFGGVASDYERYRPGPPVAAVDWLLPKEVGAVVDLGAGTGGLTRLLLGRARDIFAVEPDDRMRSVLTEQVPGIRAVNGRGESMPIPDGSVDAVLASSSWHWMDPLPTFREVGRILRPGGVLGALWAGPDPEGEFIVQAEALLAEQVRGPRDDVAGLVMGEAHRPALTLEIPDGVPFDQPDHEVFRWNVALNADELIGLLGTVSWIITMPDETRVRIIAEVRRLLREFLGVEGAVTVDVAFRSDAWRSRRHSIL